MWKPFNSRMRVSEREGGDKTKNVIIILRQSPPSSKSTAAESKGVTATYSESSEMCSVSRGMYCFPHRSRGAVCGGGVGMRNSTAVSDAASERVSVQCT